MSESNGRAVEVLKAAGFGDAARCLERLDAIDKQAADEVDESRPEPQRQFDAAEAERQAEAQVMLRALRESGVVD